MPNCKYIKQQEIVSYNGGVDWQNVMPAQYRKGQLIEHDSEDCGELDVIYRWRKLTGVYLCIDDVKYEKLILDESYDGGLSWYPAYPSQYTTGEEIGVDEDYCNDKFVGHYILTDDDVHHDCPRNYRWNGFECVYVDPIKVVKCDGNPELTRTDTAYYSSYSSSYWFILRSAEIGKCVTSIAARAFTNSSAMTYVSMADSVTTIGEYAFRGCTSLSGMNTTIPGELNIPSGVTSIGDCAFYNCSGITSIICNPTTPPSIGYNAFYGTNNCPIYVPCGSFWAYMDSWSNLDYRLNPIGGESCVPMRARYDYNGGFRTYYCRGTDTVVDSGDTDGIGVERSAITSVYIGSCATEIGDYAFSRCSGLASINIPDSVTSIGNNPFSQCTSLPVENYIRYADTYAIEATDKSLTSYTLKNNTRWIGSGVFRGCSGLTSIDIPDSVTSIRGNAFMNCTSLTSCTIGNGVISIDGSAFYQCSSLTSIDIPNGVTTIGDYAFYGCSGLTSATIGNGVTSIGEYAFGNCFKLRSISIPNGVTSIKQYTFYGCTGMTNCTIGTGVTSIDQAAFMNCSGLTSINIPDSVTSIGDNAFGYCYRLTSATIGNGVTKIGSRAFIQCYRLTSCTIGTGVTTIGDYAFSGCTNLTSIEIPSGVTSIKEYAFNGCTSLTSITVNATTPPTLGSVVFTNTNDCPIYVPAASVNSYKAATNWRGYASRIQAIT